MTELSRSRWKGVPAEDRTAERRAVLLDVAFDLLGSGGMTGTTVRGVCEAARLNPRYFYESFDDLDALLVAVFDRTALEAVNVMVQAAAASDPAPEAQMRASIGALVRHLSEDPRRTRVIFMEGLSNEALGRKRFDTMHDLAEGMVRDAMGGEIPEEPGVVPSILRVSANLAVGGMAEILISWASGRLEVTLEELIDDSTEIMVRMAYSIEAIAIEREAARAAAERTGS